jgi:hypothetical protein
MNARRVGIAMMIVMAVLVTVSSSGASARILPRIATTVEPVPSSFDGSPIPNTCPATVDVTIPLYDWINTLPQGSSATPTEVLFAPGGCYLINGMIFLRGLTDFIFDGNESTFSQTTAGFPPASPEPNYNDPPPARAAYGCPPYLFPSNASSALAGVLRYGFDIMWFVEGGCNIIFDEMNIVGADPLGNPGGMTCNTKTTWAIPCEQDSAIEVAGAQQVLITDNTISGVYGDFVTVTGLHEGLYGGLFDPSFDVTIDSNGDPLASTCTGFCYSGRDGVTVAFADRVDVADNSILNPAVNAIDIEADVSGNKGGEENIVVSGNRFYGYKEDLIAADTYGLVSNLAFTDNLTGPDKVSLDAASPAGNNINISENDSTSAATWSPPGGQPYADNNFTNETFSSVSYNTVPLNDTYTPVFVRAGASSSGIYVERNTLNGIVASTYPLVVPTWPSSPNPVVGTECNNATPPGPPTGVSLDAKPDSLPLVNCTAAFTSFTPIQPTAASLPSFYVYPLVRLHRRRAFGDSVAAPTGGFQPGTVSCKDLSGTIDFDPPLTSVGASSEMSLVYVTAKGCSGAGGGATPKVGNASMLMPLQRSSCSGLESASTTPTSLVTSWSPSNLGASEVIFPGVTPIPTEVSAKTGFSFGGTGTTIEGSYPGTDDGVSSTATLTSNMTAGQIAKACDSANGLTSLNVRGTLNLK